MAGEGEDRERYFRTGRGQDRRKVLPGERRTFQVDHIWESHHEVMRRILLGQKNTEIAKATGLTAATISYIRNSPVIQEQLQILEGARDAKTVDLASEIRAFAPVAHRLLTDIINGEGTMLKGEKPSLRQRAREANNLMDRAGYSAVRNVQGQFLHGHFTADEIEEIKQRAIKEGYASGDVVDVEPEAPTAQAANK